jgi:cyanophycinase
VIGWASAIPETYYQDISDELRRAGVQHFIPALMAPQGDKERKLFLKDLDQATGVFFTGGDQNKAMAVVEKFKFKNAIQSKFLSGVPFMGTSAGTAMMAETMMTGDSTPPGTGLGLLKAPLIDMHFLKRNREPRLLAAMESTHVPYGIGVDEAGALEVMNSESATVLGEPHVVFYHNKDGKLDRVELGLGQKFNLGEWHEN